MPIRTLSRRRRVSAVSAFACLAAAPILSAATDNDPANDSMTGAEALSTIVGQRTTHSAQLIQLPDQLDVDFFMIEALAGDAVTVTLVRIADEGITNNAPLNLRLHAYTPDAYLISDPGVGDNPSITFSSPTDGVIYLGVGLECDTDLDGLENADPDNRDSVISEVESFDGFYSIEITIDRQSTNNTVLFENPADCEEEVNGFCDLFETFVVEDGTIINGQITLRYRPGCEPDTYMVLFDKDLNIVDQNDNNISCGNGWASGIFGIDDSTGFTDDGDGTRTLRIGVTGRPDGLDGDFNGLFQNAGHAQKGEFLVTTDFRNAVGDIILTETYLDEFVSGAEAFYINYEIPADAVTADICIDNTIGLVPYSPDFELFHFENLIPFCDYYLTQIGGLNENCRPTQLFMVWLNKDCFPIWFSEEYDPETGYHRLWFIPDYLGRAHVGLVGLDDEFILDPEMNPMLGAQSRAPENCEDDFLPPLVDGCYTLLIEAFLAAHGGDNTDGAAAETDILDAMSRGDINMDGATDTADLGILLGAFGWIN